MITKAEIITAAHENGFGDVGFTTAAPFDVHREYLLEHQEEYVWAKKMGLDLINGTDPKTILPEAKTIVVLLEIYFKASYPHPMENHFGRCYLDDDRITKTGLRKRIDAFRDFLRTNGIESKVPGNLPHRVAAARAGLGTIGRNCLVYSSRAARGSSWNLPIVFVIDHEFPPDEPETGNGCPDWCRNACIMSCPTRALKGNGRIDPRKCISFLSYFGEGITPEPLREAMGMYVYGCDRCQNVCPRNAAWLAKELPVNQRAAVKADDFKLPKLLHMDKTYFKKKIWPHMFYMPYEEVWRWKMNVARVMGNTSDACYTDHLIRAFRENNDERVQGMIAWALGKIGDRKCKKALDDFSGTSKGLVAEEIVSALKKISRKDKKLLL